MISAILPLFFFSFARVLLFHIADTFKFWRCSNYQLLWLHSQLFDKVWVHPKTLDRWTHFRSLARAFFWGPKINLPPPRLPLRQLRHLATASERLICSRHTFVPGLVTVSARALPDSLVASGAITLRAHALIHRRQCWPWIRSSR